jgi:DNA-binding XRE family transcriptional regulator
MTEKPQYMITYFGGEEYIEGTGKFGMKVPAKHGKGSGMNTEYYSLGNIGWWLSIQRRKAGVTRTTVARRMGYPGGAIKAIEEGKRVPEASTVQRYILALKGVNVNNIAARTPDMYARFHS